MRTSHLLAVLSLSTALVTASPAFAAFEFLSKATPKTNTASPAPATVAPVATPVAAKPAIVPVSKIDDDVPISDMAKAPPEVPVWTAKPLPVAKTIDVKTEPTPMGTKAIPLTPVVASSDSLQMIDGPLVPDDMPAPVAAPILKPIQNNVAADTKGTMVPDAKRQVLARSSGALDMDAPVAPAPVKSTARDAIMWDNGKAPVTNDISAMTTEKSSIGLANANTGTGTAKPTWAPLPPPVKAEAPLNLTAQPTTKMPAAPSLADTVVVEDHPMAPLPDMKPEPIGAMAAIKPAAPPPIVETIIEPAVAVAPADDKVVEGFGTSLPLALALRQIVPPTYRFSFGPNVDPGQRVSWQGGRKWSQIIQDMASKQGLTTEIAGNVVAIRSNGSPAGFSAAQDNMMEQVVLGTVTPAPLMNPPPPPLPLPVTKMATSDAKPMDLAHQSVTTNSDETIIGKNMAMNDTAKHSAEKTMAMPAPLPPITEDDDAPLPPPAKPLQEKLAETKPAPITPVAGNDMAVAMAQSQEWTAHSGQSLRAILQDWSKQANVSLVWSSNYDYPLQTDIRIQGTYPDAVRTLLAGFSKAQPKPIGRLHKNANVGAQPVLIVDTPRLING